MTLDDIQAIVASVNKLILEKHELLGHVKGLIGLVQIISHRDDLSAELKDVLATNHRYVDAVALVARIEANDRGAIPTEAEAHASIAGASVLLP